MDKSLIGFPTSTLPEVLYHYCGVQGLKGIIEGKAIWLSDVRYCNDYMEHNWLKEKYDEVIDCLRHQSPVEFHEALAAEKANYREHLAFIACFSTECDVLSQWRAYADDGAGFAIGFNLNYFNLNMSPPRYGLEESITHGLFPVCYDEKNQKRQIERVIDHYRQKASPTMDPSEVKKLAEECYFNLQMVSITCKNPAFAEEKEWRIVYRPIIWRKATGLEIHGGNSKIDFRTSRSNLIPYFSFEFSVQRQCRPIEKIVLGPKQSLSRERDVLTWFLDQNQVDVRLLQQSSATYR
jgi:hypothetical protein